MRRAPTSSLTIDVEPSMNRTALTLLLGTGGAALLSGAVRTAHAQLAAQRPVCVASAPSAPRTDVVADTARASRFVAALDPCMRRMHTEMHRALVGAAGDTDARFAAAMIPHHQGAIDMARQLLVHGRDPALRAFALGLIAEQQAEIQMLRTWLARSARGGAPPTIVRTASDPARVRAARSGSPRQQPRQQPPPPGCSRTGPAPVCPSPPR
jgi:hypothetical protein